jgi:hypothetical protein
MDGSGAGGSPNYFAAVADLARDVGGVSAQVNERVTYKELMAQNTQQRHEITSRIDKVESHLTGVVGQSVTTLEARIESLSTQINAMTVQISALNSVRPGGVNAKVAVVGSLATTVGAAIGLGGYMILRSFGVAP